MIEPWPRARYAKRAPELAARFESAPPGRLHAWLLGRLPPAGALAVDLGAGSGRDAAWLARRGCRILAVEPSAEMRRAAAAIRPADPAVEWIDDELPALARLAPFDGRAAFVLACAVWMHMDADAQDRGMRRVARLLAPGGTAAFTIPKEGSPATARGVVGQARRAGLAPVLASDLPDVLARPGQTWTQIAAAKPDDQRPSKMRGASSPTSSSSSSLSRARSTASSGKKFSGERDAAPGSGRTWQTNVENARRGLKSACSKIANVTDHRLLGSGAGW